MEGSAAESGGTDWGSLFGNVVSKVAEVAIARENADVQKDLAQVTRPVSSSSYPFSGMGSMFGPAVGGNNTQGTIARQGVDMSFNWQALIVPMLLAVVGVVVLKKVL